MDGIRLLGLHPQRFKRFRMTTVTNERLDESLQPFERFGVSAAIIPMDFYSI